jgi:DNA-binding NarL/FixJ family response regulator
MPEMNGWECLESLKKEDQLKHIPVIMYSTSSSKVYGERAIRSGAMAFYVKPPNFLQLQDFLKSIAGSSSNYLKNTLDELRLSKKPFCLYGLTQFAKQQAMNETASGGQLEDFTDVTGLNGPGRQGSTA